jgi:uncharacterized protein YcnI
MIPCPTWPRAVLLALALLVLVVAPAAAHPGVRGGELPVDSLATMTLATNHGCGTHDDAEEAATTGVTLEVPDWLRVVEVPADGWELTLERDDRGRTTVVTWEDDDPSTVAPDVDLEVVASGAPGETRYLRVLQTCGELVERWIGTPDEPADQPAVRVVLGAPDPDAPAPPPEDPPAPDETATPDATGDVTDTTEEAGFATEEPDDLAADTADTAEEAEGAADDTTLDASPVTADDPGFGRWLVVAAGVAVALAGFARWRTRRGGAGA